MIIRLARACAIVVVLLGAGGPLLQATYCVPPGPVPQPPFPDLPLPPCGPWSNQAAQSGGSTSCDICSKSPCYLSSGTYVNNFVDLRIPTAGMYPLVVSRHYESGRPADGPMGVGWSSTLTAHLYLATYLVSANTYTYEADVLMPSGLQYHFTMSGNSFVAPAGSFDTLVKNGDGTYSLTLQHTRSVFRFSADGSVTSLTDDYGNAISYSYDGSGKLTRVADAAGSGRYIDVTWSPQGRIATLTDNAGRIVNYFYDGAGKLISYSDPVASTDSSQRTAYYSYVAGRFGPVLSRIEDRWHRTITNLTWYGDGRLQSYTDGDYNDANPSASPGEKYTYAYSGNTATKSDSLGSRSFVFSSSGVANDLTRTFDTVTGVTTAETAPDGHSTSYSYNARGNVATATPDGGVVWTYTYDSTYPDQVASITSNVPNQWAGTRYTYNTSQDYAPGALKTVSRIGSDGVGLQIAYYSYDPKGHVTTIFDPNGRTTVYTYNASGDLTSVAAGGGGPTTSYEYDSLGRVTKVTTPTGNATSYTYDGDDRVTTIVPPSPATVPALDFTTRMSYDNFDATSGLVNVTTTDPNGHVMSRGYDALGHLIQATDALGKTTQYAYQYNLLQSITDANANVTSYQYNANRYLVKTVFFDGAFETYTVNPTGGVTSMTDRKGQTATYYYDGYGRLTYVSYGSGSGAPSLSYSYSGQNLGGVTDARSSPAVSVSYTYDSQWRLATETQAAGKITYAYDTPAGDELASYRLDPPFGQNWTAVTANMTYDSAARLSRIDWSPVTGGFTFAYNGDGQYTTVGFPNGQTRTFAYDRQGRLTSLANLDTQGHNLVTYAYSYDFDWPTQAYTSLGNRTSVTVTGSASLIPNGTNKYVYDASGQLTNVTRTDGTNVTYDYDAIGNRTRVATQNGGALSYTYFLNTAQKNTPRLRNPGGTDLAYDANGNLTTYGYSWDVSNRLSSISGSQYLYDYQNRRSVYTPSPGSGAPVNYLSVGLNTAAERSTDTARTNDYLFGPGIDEPLARRASDGSLSYYVVDGLGSVIALASSSGQFTTAASYDEWGTVTTHTVDLFGYAGREVASPTNSTLWFNRARYCAPNWGRFISEDPLRFVGSAINWYQYASGNPVLLTDPLGLQPCRFGEPTTQICAVGPLDAAEARNLAQEAFSAARQSHLQGAHNGPQDAFRHCYWSCRMAQEIGADEAKKVGDTHELCGGGPANENAMDEFNNAIGRSVGLPRINCAGVCLALVKGGITRNHP